MQYCQIVTVIAVYKDLIGDCVISHVNIGCATMPENKHKLCCLLMV